MDEYQPVDVVTKYTIATEVNYYRIRKELIKKVRSYLSCRANNDNDKILTRITNNNIKSENVNGGALSSK